MISIIHPSRGRPEDSARTIGKWLELSLQSNEIEILVSLDDDEEYKHEYTYYHLEKFFGWGERRVLVRKNRSAIDAINNAAKISTGNVLIVVSDDTEPFQYWDAKLLEEIEGKTDFILKTQDGIQKYIITMPIMDRAYYNRFGYIYHPDFQHLFCDTWLTVQADISGRKITSNLMFKHNHYSVNGTPPDELHKRNDATWKQGEETFIRLLKTLSPEDLKKIEDPSMRNWIRNKGIRV